MDHRSEKPAPLLVKYLPCLPKGNVLDIASGYGRNAFYLASHGYPVAGFDRDEAAVAFCSETANRMNLPFSANCIDLEKEIPFKEDAHVLVTCFYYLDRKIIPNIKKTLRVGGVIMYETFLIDQHHRFGKPSRTSFCWEHNELLQHFLDFRILFYHEGQIFEAGESASNQGRWVAQLIAQRIT